MRPDAIALPPMNYDFYYRYHIINIQGYLQRMRLQSRMYGLYIVSYLIYIRFPATLNFFLSFPNHLVSR